MKEVPEYPLAAQVGNRRMRRRVCEVARDVRTAQDDIVEMHVVIQMQRNSGVEHHFNNHL